MNRRRYLQLMGCAGVAPALPAIAPAAPAVAPSAVQYAWAAHYAKVHTATSPARLVSALKVSPEVAQGLIHKLTANGVIHAPAAGVSATVTPFRKAQFLQPSGQSWVKRVLAQVETFASDTQMQERCDDVLPDEAPEGPSSATDAEEHRRPTQNWRPRQDSNLQPAP